MDILKQFQSWKETWCQDGLQMVSKSHLVFKKFFKRPELHLFFCSVHQCCWTYYQGSTLNWPEQYTAKNKMYTFDCLRCFKSWGFDQCMQFAHFSQRGSALHLSVMYWSVLMSSPDLCLAFWCLAPWLLLISSPCSWLSDQFPMLYPEGHMKRNKYQRFYGGQKNK